MDSYTASNGSCFTVTWTIFKKRLIEVGLTQNHDTTALRTLTTVNLFYYHMWEHAWIETHFNSIWLRAPSHMTSHYTRGPVTTLHDFGGVGERPFNLCTLPFGLSQLFNGHGSWLAYETALRMQRTRAFSLVDVNKWKLFKWGHGDARAGNYFYFIFSCKGGFPLWEPPPRAT